MTGQGRADASAEEMARAREELEAAERLMAAGLDRVAVTRAYYACFHAARALLASRDVEPRTHQGTLRLFNLHFVRTGRFEPATGRWLASLQRYREEADYGEAALFDAKAAREQVDGAKAFVARIARELAAT